MKPYPKYKDSGVEWIGEIPEHWRCSRHKFLFSSSMGQTILKEDLVDGGSIPVFSATENGDVFGYVNEARVRLVAGDYVIPARGVSIGSVLRIRENATCTQTTIYSKRRAEAMLGEGFAFYFMSGCRQHLFQYDRTAIPQITVDQVSNNPLLYPPPVEQETIARFLDAKTAQIDELMEKKRRQIELLKEYRASVISEAVTKGLNPNVRMKDSGVEWIGKIPEHWRCSHLKYLCSLLRDGTHQPPERVDNGIPILSVRNIVDGRFVNLPDDSMISHEHFRELRRSFDVRENDVLLAIVGATLGKTAIVEKMPPCTIQRSLAIFRTQTEKMSHKFLAYLFQSHLFQAFLWSKVGFSAQPGIYLGTLADARMPLPTMCEQERIVSHLDTVTPRTDSLIAMQERQIESLQSYRTSLISEAVTGKIDVRDWSPA